MAVTVSPDEFTLVFYNSTDIGTIGQEILDHLGITGSLHIEVNETTPLSRISVARAADGSLKVAAESGAFEDTQRPRAFSAAACATSLTRALLRLRDREDGSFADAPADGELSLAQTSAWDLYVIGRFSRMGYPINRQRWLYNFRNRHGFTDATDEVFDRILGADQLTWGQLDELSHSAIAA